MSNSVIIMIIIIMKLIENKFLSSREWDLQRELSALTPILRAIYINLRTYLIKKIILSKMC